MKNKVKKFLISLMVLILISFTFITPSQALIDNALSKGKKFIEMGKNNTPNVGNITSVEFGGAATVSLIAGWLLIVAAVVIIVKLAIDNHMNPATGNEGRIKRAKQMAMVIPIIIAGILMINATNITLWFIDIFEGIME